MTDKELTARLEELLIARFNKLQEMLDSILAEDGKFEKLSDEYDVIDAEFKQLMDKKLGLDPFPEF